MKKLIPSVLVLTLIFPAVAHASFIEEVKQLPGNVILIGSGAIKLTDTAMHFVWDTVHNKFIHPMANALAETVEVVTFETVDINGNGQ